MFSYDSLAPLQYLSILQIPLPSPLSQKKHTKKQKNRIYAAIPGFIKYILTMSGYI